MLDKRLNQAQQGSSAGTETSGGLQDFSLDREAGTAVTQSRIVTMLRQEGVETQRINISGSLSSMDDKNVIELAKDVLGIPRDPSTRGEITPELKEKLKAYAPDSVSLSGYYNSRTEAAVAQSAAPKGPKPEQAAKPAQIEVSKPVEAAKPANTKPAVEATSSSGAATSSVQQQTPASNPAPSRSAAPTPAGPAEESSPAVEREKPKAEARKEANLLGGSTSANSTAVPASQMQVGFPSSAPVESAPAAVSPVKPLSGAGSEPDTGNDVMSMIAKRRAASEAHIAQLTKDVEDGGMLSSGVSSALTARIESETRFLEQLKGLEQSKDIKGTFRKLLDEKSKSDATSAAEVNSAVNSLENSASVANGTARVIGTVATTAAGFTAGVAATTAAAASGFGAPMALPAGMAAGFTAATAVSTMLNTVRASGEYLAGNKAYQTAEADMNAGMMGDVKTNFFTSLALPFGHVAGRIAQNAAGYVGGLVGKLAPTLAAPTTRVVERATAAGATGGTLSVARTVDRRLEAEREFVAKYRGSNITEQDSNIEHAEFMAERRLDPKTMLTDIQSDAVVAALTGNLFGGTNPASSTLVNGLRATGNTAANVGVAAAAAYSRGGLDATTGLSIVESQIAGYASRKVSTFWSPNANVEVGPKPRAERSGKPTGNLSQGTVEDRLDDIVNLIQSRKPGEALQAANDPNLLAALDLKSSPLKVTIEPTINARTQRGQHNQMDQRTQLAAETLSRPDYNREGAMPPTIGKGSYTKNMQLDANGEVKNVPRRSEEDIWERVELETAQTHLGALTAAYNRKFPTSTTTPAGPATPPASTAASGATGGVSTPPASSSASNSAASASSTPPPSSASSASATSTPTSAASTNSAAAAATPRSPEELLREMFSNFRRANGLPPMGATTTRSSSASATAAGSAKPAGDSTTSSTNAGAAKPLKMGEANATVLPVNNPTATASHVAGQDVVDVLPMKFRTADGRRETIYGSPDDPSIRDGSYRKSVEEAVSFLNMTTPGQS